MGAIMARKKAITKNDLAKAIEEAYHLGVQHGQQGKKTLGMLSPEIESQISIAALKKNLDDNSQKINIELIKQHRSLVLKHMKDWSKDAESALEEVLSNIDHKH